MLLVRPSLEARAVSSPGFEDEPITNLRVDPLGVDNRMNVSFKARIFSG